MIDTSNCSQKNLLYFNYITGVKLTLHWAVFSAFFASSIDTAIDSHILISETVAPPIPPPLPHHWQIYKFYNKRALNDLYPVQLPTNHFLSIKYDQGPISRYPKSFYFQIPLDYDRGSNNSDIFELYKTSTWIYLRR